MQNCRKWRKKRDFDTDFVINRYVGSQKFVEIWGPTPLGCGRGWLHRNPLLHHLCYRAKCGHSRSKHTSERN